MSLRLLGVDAEMAEREIIAAALSPGGTAVISTLSSQDHLEAHHFSTAAYSLAWRACLERLGRDEAVTLELVVVDVDPSGRNPGLRDILGRAVAAGYGSVKALRSYAARVIDAAERRSWDAAGDALKQAALDGDEKGLRRAEELLRTSQVSQDSYDPEEMGLRATLWLSDKTAPPALSTGFPAINDKIGGGFRPGDITFIGGHTSMGKSSLVDGFLSHAVLASGKTAHVFGNEMSVEDRTLRVIADLSGVPYARLALRSVRDTDWPRIYKAAGQIPFSMTQANQWSVDQICRAIYHHRWDLWAVDHIHNMQYRDREELEAIIRTLAACAASTGTHGILVGQLNEGRNATDIPPFPAMRDIRDTGMIKHVASQVFMIHRDHKRENDEVQVSTEGTLSFPKARHGETGSLRVNLNTVRLRYHAPYTSVSDVDDSFSFATGNGNG